MTFCQVECNCLRDTNRSCPIHPGGQDCQSRIAELEARCERAHEALLVLVAGVEVLGMATRIATAHEMALGAIAALEGE